MAEPNWPIKDGVYRPAVRDVLKTLDELHRAAELWIADGGRRTESYTWPSSYWPVKHTIYCDVVGSDCPVGVEVEELPTEGEGWEVVACAYKHSAKCRAATKAARAKKTSAKKAGQSKTAAKIGAATREGPSTLPKTPVKQGKRPAPASWSGLEKEKKRPRASGTPVMAEEPTEPAPSSAPPRTGQQAHIAPPRAFHPPQALPDNMVRGEDGSQSDGGSDMETVSNAVQPASIGKGDSKALPASVDVVDLSHIEDGDDVVIGRRAKTVRQQMVKRPWEDMERVLSCPGTTARAVAAATLKSSEETSAPEATDNPRQNSSKPRRTSAPPVKQESVDTSDLAKKNDVSGCAPSKGPSQTVVPQPSVDPQAATADHSASADARLPHATPKAPLVPPPIASPRPALKQSTLTGPQVSSLKMTKAKAPIAIKGMSRGRDGYSQANLERIDPSAAPSTTTVKVEPTAQTLGETSGIRRQRTMPTPSASPPPEQPPNSSAADDIPGPMPSTSAMASEDPVLASIPNFPPSVTARFRLSGVVTKGDLLSRGVQISEVGELLRHLSSQPSQQDDTKAGATPAFDEIEEWAACKRLGMLYPVDMQLVDMGTRTSEIMHFPKRVSDHLKAFRIECFASIHHRGVRREEIKEMVQVLRRARPPRSSSAGESPACDELDAWLAEKRLATF